MDHKTKTNAGLADSYNPVAVWAQWQVHLCKPCAIFSFDVMHSVLTKKKKVRAEQHGAAGYKMFLST